MHDQWLTGWGAWLDAATNRALHEVLASYPFEPGDHRIGPAATTADLADLRQRAPWIPDDLLTLYQSVGPVSLPDIGIGYFIHPPHTIAAQPDSTADHHPDRLGAPTLLIGGGAASPVPRQHVAELADRLAHARLTTIEAGHLVHEAVPDQYLRTLIAFLTE